MRRILPIAILMLACALPALAESRATGDLGLRQWGVRLGVGADPDQAIGGFQFDLGDVADRLRLEPNVELGVGDDHTVISLSAPVHYRFDVDSDLEPYAGGGLSVAFDFRDLPSGSDKDDEDVEIGFRFIGGVEWRLKDGKEFRIELSLHAGLVHDAEVMAVWSF